MVTAEILTTIISSALLFLGGAYVMFLMKRRSFEKLAVFVILLLVTVFFMNTLAVIPLSTIERTTQIDANTTQTQITIVYGENPYNRAFYLPLFMNAIGTIFYAILTFIDYIGASFKSLRRLFR